MNLILKERRLDRQIRHRDWAGISHRMIVEIPSLAVRIHTEITELFNSYDRVRSGARFRFSIMSPLGFAFAAIPIVVGPDWTCFL